MGFNQFKYLCAKHKWSSDLYGPGSACPSCKDERQHEKNKNIMKAAIELSKERDRKVKAYDDMVSGTPEQSELIQLRAIQKDLSKQVELHEQTIENQAAIIGDLQECDIESKRLREAIEKVLVRDSGSGWSYVMHEDFLILKAALIQAKEGRG